ncbi:hypothetical protein V8C86DRAFT_1825070 [Haematococcus lacustris]
MVVQWRPLLKSASVGFIGGVLIWGVGDVLGELTTFTALRSKGITLANDNTALKEQIGYPFSVGSWYDSSIGFSAGGKMAQCKFSLKTNMLQGTKQITDVTVRGIRKDGVASNALYNLMGPGTWSVLDCTAMFPSGGGMVSPQSLLPSPPPRSTAADLQPSMDNAGPGMHQGSGQGSNGQAQSPHHQSPTKPSPISMHQGSASSVDPAQGGDVAVGEGGREAAKPEVSPQAARSRWFGWFKKARPTGTSAASSGGGGMSEV